MSKKGLLTRQKWSQDEEKLQNTKWDFILIYKYLKRISALNLAIIVKKIPCDCVYFGYDCGWADLLCVLEAFREGLGEAGFDGEVPVSDLRDDLAVANADVVTVPVHTKLTFGL